jgi:hypothetical protein
MTPETRVELQRLLSALCEGELAQDQHARLEGLLRADADCRRLYLEYLDMHARLLLHPRLAAGRIPSVEGRDESEPSSRSTRNTAAPPLFPDAAWSEGKWPDAGRRRAGQALRYILVAAGTLAASLLVQALVPPRTPDRSTTGIREQAGMAEKVEAQSPSYVATLAQTANCVWEEGAPVRTKGAHFLPGALRLKQGIARLHFESGSDLLIEGPAVLRIDSATAATLLQGKAVFRGDETCAPFDLQTPSSTLVDLGTEYAVVVSPEGEEVHVFDGQVQRTPKQEAGQVTPERLGAGQARRYAPSAGAASEPVALDQVRFVRQVTNPDEPPPDPASGLLAYEGFDYDDPKVFRARKANGGIGWTTPWRGFARPVNPGDQNRFALNAKESLSRPGIALPMAGGCLDYTGFARYVRQLATPVRLDTDEVYYLSFLFRRYGPATDAVNTVSLQLRTSEELKEQNPHQRLHIGVGKSNRLFTVFDRARAGTPLPLKYGETYLLVAKIVASAKHADQVFLRIYGEDEPVDGEEPDSWSVVGCPFECNLVFDQLEIHINSNARQMMDEVRLGVSWSSVVAPWISGPPNRERKP